MQATRNAKNQVPPNNAKYNQRKLSPTTATSSGQDISSARGPIRRRHHSHDPSAGRGQRRAHESGPATITADPPATYTTARAGPTPKGPNRHRENGRSWSPQPHPSAPNKRDATRAEVLSLTQFWISDAKLDHRNRRFQLICPSFYCFFSLLRRCYKYTTAQGEKTYQQKAQRKAHLLLSWALVCSKKKGDGRGGAERGRPFGAKCP